jgi:hypothetical protein
VKRNSGCSEREFNDRWGRLVEVTEAEPLRADANVCQTGPRCPRNSRISVRVLSVNCSRPVPKRHKREKQQTRDYWAELGGIGVRPDPEWFSRPPPSTARPSLRTASITYSSRSDVWTFTRAFAELRRLSLSRGQFRGQASAHAPLWFARIDTCQTPAVRIPRAWLAALSERRRDFTLDSRVRGGPTCCGWWRSPRS